jgi:hypothetical protein
MRCHFGQWLAKEGSVRHGAQSKFAALDALHRQAHVLAEELCVLYTKGYAQEAQSRMGELHALRDALLELVQSLLTQAV